MKRLNRPIFTVTFARPLFSNVLAMVFSASMVLAPVANALSFYDVGAGHWAQSDIDTVTSAGIMSGYPDGSFKPNAPLNRAAFAATVSKMLNLSSSGTPQSFSDVPYSHWSYNAVSAVVDHGLMTPFSGSRFLPDKPMTRAEAFTVFTKAQGVTLPNAQQTEQLLGRFNDANEVPAWARPYVAAAIGSNLYVPSPYGGAFINPNQNMSRAEIAALAENKLAMNTVATNNPLPVTPAVMAQQPPPAYAASNTVPTVNSTNNSGAAFQGYVSFIPANTVLKTTATTSLDSQTARIGDLFELVLAENLTSPNASAAIPSGSKIVGEVSRVQKATRAERGAEIEVNFNRILAPNGQVFPMSAEFNTKKGFLDATSRTDWLVRGGLRTAGGAAVGAGTGAILGGLKGGGLADDYLARGAIIGAAVGAGSQLLTKGDEIHINTGQPVELRLRQPLNLPGQ
ncbi:MAG: S-layer homology domain-containing protein [Cyanobacteria bacterium HKST-UBA03]|nr:S-layer homology domain-containing protein [Cyanobacteria bacterium HKST-UBA03]